MESPRRIFGGETLTILVLIVVPVALAIGVVYVLHTPTPRQRTSIPLTRNSLLPHRFAGPCINCHKISEVGPVTMNHANMGLFNLTTPERRLLAAGQRVDVPSAAQQVRMPAITRDDVLPHTFVGVCSNCHVVLDIRPSSAFMARAMERARTPLGSMGLTQEQIARAGARQHDTREFLRNLWGFVALGFFILMVVYVLMRTAMRLKPQQFKGKFDLKRWFNIHEWAAVGFTGAAILHWHYSDRGNNLLHVALLLAIWLTLAGGVLHYRLPETRGMKKGVRLVHSQRFLFYLLVILMVVGHLFAEFE